MSQSALSLLETIGDERGFDIYDLLQKLKNLLIFRSQNRLYVNSQTYQMNHKQVFERVSGVANNGYHL